MSKLYIVRHAQVTVDFRIRSSEWTISQEGIDATRQLVLNHSWNDVQRIYHSPELKAVGTAEVVGAMTGIPTTVVDDLRELRVPHIDASDEFIRRVGAFLMGFPDPECEPWDQATQRIVGAIAAIAAEVHGHSAAVVSHGRILTVWFSHLFQRRMSVAEWQSIRLPDLSIIDLDTGTVERGFFSNISV